MIHGSCLCGAVKFKLKKSGILLFNLCHCSRCQKRSGTAHTSQLQIAADKFQWIQGTDCMSWYESSLGSRSSFCSTCGSRLPMHTNNNAMVAVPAGLIDDEFGVQPEINMHCASAASWHTLDKSITSIEGQGTDEFWKEFMMSKSN